MFIIEVIPLTTLPPNVPQLLSYFHIAKLNKGSMVEISIGRRRVKAIVVSCSSLEEQKGTLKKSLFQIKKISKVISKKPMVSEIQFKILLWLSHHYYTPLGLSLKTVFPSFLINKKYRVQNIEPPETHTKPRLIISPSHDLEVKLLNVISRTKGQILIIVPDRFILNHFKSLLEKYKPITIHSSQSDKEKFKNWRQVQGGSKLVVGTRLALFYAFKNLDTIIVEDPLNEMYKSDMTPKYNTPDLAEAISQIYGIKLISISPFAGIVNYYKAKNGSYILTESRSKLSPDIKIINTTNELRAENFSLLSRELKKEILNTIEKNKKVLIFSPRRGYSGLLLCQNCGTSVKCQNCSVPMHVHKSTELILICHRCSQNQQFPKFCLNCNSYKLKTAGPSGSQKIYDEIRELVSGNQLKSTILILDSDIVKNETETEETINEVKKPGSTVLIASQMVFSHRYDMNFDIVGILNADSLSTIPTFNIEEKLLYHIQKIKDFNPRNLFIQACSSDDPIYKTISSDNYNNFYNSELEIRKLFIYPPFCRLAKLTYRHVDERKALLTARILVEKLKMVAVQDRFNNQVIILDASPAYVSREKRYYIYNIILKISPNMANLKNILKYVPSDWSIDLDPKTIL